jgi:hypothetical protein
MKRFAHCAGLIVALALLIAVPVSAQADKPLTNDDILQMIKAGFDEETVVKAIAASSTNFDISVGGLLALKQAGVSEQIIKAMLDAEARKRSSAAAVTPSALQGAETLKSELISAYLLQGQEKMLLTRNTTRIAQTKAKSQDLASLAADGAVEAVLTEAMATATVHAAVSAGMATGGMAATPILGAGASVMTGILMARRKPTVTYVWALPGRASSLVLKDGVLQFELHYSDIPGVDPDEFEPAIIMLEPTPNNWRLAGATKAKTDVFQQDPRNFELYSSFSEKRVPVRITPLGRGHARIEPDSPLQPGEYALCLRPIAKNKKFSGLEIGTGQGEGLLFNSLWDFAVRSPELEPRQEP